ncbi:hypothetical protein EHQ27_11210 [Leptospira wolffii]|uniref:DUF6989 domain-containing protein n=1 Tax=Leptospira wolffii TaxID=409998 RepID=UPI00108387B3|nr:hypothetical protein [Leptospira wolffii]TGK56938.1 hypothetical protein EHQ32_15290 [Leptospira wolffii]TGK70972.1 hypothetical protein EHQ27_11210 [Leptospira wolffii]TGK75663.1 hypothetical protein EHQ35_04660 [Leptospira wolffii]TGL32710.1 hypothetical protein EHQ57_01620 [Leptospira wolffii]
MKTTEKHALFFHGAFALLCIIVLLLPIPTPSGWRMFFLVLVYNLSLPIVAQIWKHDRWMDIFLFVFPVSVLQVFPDWFLSRVLGVLVFPDDGFFKIGTVSAYMVGLWTIPLFLTIFSATRFAKRYPEANPISKYAVAGIVSFLIFLFSEEFMRLIPVWHAQNVSLIGHVAVYVLLPELLLGVFSTFAYFHTEHKPFRTKLLWAIPTFLVYLGALSWSFLLIEGVNRPL